MKEKPVFLKARIQTQTGPIGPKTGPKLGLIFEDFCKLSVEQRIFKIGPFLTELETFLLMQYIDSKYVHMQMCNWSLSSGVVRVGSMGSTEPTDFHKLSIYPLFRTSRYIQI